MKQTLTGLTILLIFLSLSAFSQTVKKDTVTVTKTIYVITIFDTAKVKLYYEDGGYLKVTTGFMIREVETNSADANKNRLKSVIYMDEKKKLFTKPVFQVIPR